MGFRLVVKSVTLNDLERRNGRYLACFHRIRLLWEPITSKWLKIDVHSLWTTVQTVIPRPRDTDDIEKVTDSMIKVSRSVNLIALEPLKGFASKLTQMFPRVGQELSRFSRSWS